MPSVTGNNAYLVKNNKDANLLLNSAKVASQANCELTCLTKADCVTVDYNFISDTCSTSELDEDKGYPTDNILRSYNVHCNPELCELSLILENSFISFRIFL